MRARGLSLLLISVIGLHVNAQTPATEPAVPPSRFVGTWVGTQSWAIADPPPGSRQDQPVTLTVELVDGKLQGALTPFLGGEEGAIFREGTIVNGELQAVAVIGRPGEPGTGWKRPVRVTLAFRNEGVNLKGDAAVTMNDVPWMKFRYDLGKKRSRY
jgi:hypothetical protein